jgi:16S rRNA (cytidine1402-2'-O)-methyltransferase
MIGFTFNYKLHTWYNFSVMPKGSLYIVSTPIGNMKDITLRALDVLKECDLILSEDTRETVKVLSTYQIEKTQISYRDQNHDRVIDHILSELDSGKKIALVSDSGTPLISDPGFKLVRDVLKGGFDVLSVPGPSALISALSVSGLPTDKFSFLGFLPKSGGQRQKLLESYGGTDSTLIIYESPFRLEKLLQEILSCLGDREVCVVNDITKIYEAILRGRTEKVITLAAALKQKGEFIVLVAKKGV